VLYLLRQGYDENSVRQIVRRDTSTAGRSTQKEIDHSIERGRVFLRLGGADGDKRFRKVTNSVHKFNGSDEAIRGIRIAIQEPVELNPVGLTSVNVVSKLFHPDDIICCGKQVYDKGINASARDWIESGELANYQFIVPNTFSERGKGRRLLECVDERRFIVVEWDRWDRTTQIKLIIHLSQIHPLAMVVSSAGKSLHSWWKWVKVDWHNKRFFDYCISLGADPCKWTANGWVRLPGGWRDDINKRTKVHITGRQEILFFNPERI